MDPVLRKRRESRRDGAESEVVRQRGSSKRLEVSAGTKYDVGLGRAHSESLERLLDLVSDLDQEGEDGAP